jgi:hypothetical protein
LAAAPRKSEEVSAEKNILWIDLRGAGQYFPDWQAELDGLPIPIEPNPSGGIDVRLPAPGGTFELIRRPPRSRRIGVILSGLGAGLWLALVCVHRRWHGGARQVSANGHLRSIHFRLRCFDLIILRKRG